jgi:hypothetical protein
VISNDIYQYFTIVNFNEDRPILITFWKYNPKKNNKFEYVFEAENILKKNISGKKMPQAIPFLINCH